MKEKIFESHIKLERFNGKGGWTYAQIPQNLPVKFNQFGYAKVDALIDGFEIKNCSLMPMGKGRKFIAVNAAVRKNIRKQEGDTVFLALFADCSAISVPEEFYECLKDDPEADLNFRSYSEVEKQKFLSWIEAGSSEEEIVERMAKAIQKIARKQFLT